MSDNSPAKPHSSSCFTAPTETFSQNQQPATTGELTPTAVNNLTENDGKQIIVMPINDIFYMQTVLCILRAENRVIPATWKLSKLH